MTKVRILRVIVREFLLDGLDDYIYLVPVYESCSLDTLIDLYMGYVTWIFSGEMSEAIIDLEGCGDDTYYTDDRRMSVEGFEAYLKDHGVRMPRWKEESINFYNEDVEWF